MTQAADEQSHMIQPLQGVGKALRNQIKHSHIVCVCDQLSKHVQEITGQLRPG